MFILCWFDHFLDSWAEICQIFRWFFGKFKKSKRHSEINWPLRKSLFVAISVSSIIFFWHPSQVLATNSKIVLTEHFFSNLVVFSLKWYATFSAAKAVCMIGFPGFLWSNCFIFNDFTTLCAVIKELLQKESRKLN